mmetsp:Transcript_71452/g.232192  ORF Transcript_71452/g.232192 Transcript_71452/m.232192 type:complete len:214 (-) Transcript_71452:922-1563(-)
MTSPTSRPSPRRSLSTHGKPPTHLRVWPPYGPLSCKMPASTAYSLTSVQFCSFEGHQQSLKRPPSDRTGVDFHSKSVPCTAAASERPSSGAPGRASASPERQLGARASLRASRRRSPSISSSPSKGVTAQGCPASQVKRPRRGPTTMSTPASTKAPPTSHNGTASPPSRSESLLASITALIVDVVVFVVGVMLGNIQGTAICSTVQGRHQHKR